MSAGDSLRTSATLKRYKARRESASMDTDLRKLKTVWSGRHWIVVENEFPYDKIVQTHHLLVPVRQFSEEWEVNDAERAELVSLKELWGDVRMYDSVMVNLPHNRTVPGLFHYHLLKFISLTKFDHVG